MRARHRRGKTVVIPAQAGIQCQRLGPRLQKHYPAGARSSDLDNPSGRFDYLCTNELALDLQILWNGASHEQQIPALCLATASAVCFGTGAFAQSTVKIGELNSYKAQPAFLEPYRRGWELAVEDINAKGGVLGKKLEVISRDDG